MGGVGGCRGRIACSDETGGNTGRLQEGLKSPSSGAVGVDSRGWIVAAAASDDVRYWQQVCFTSLKDVINPNSLPFCINQPIIQ